VKRTFLSLLAVFLLPTFAAARDWERRPAVVEIDTAEDVYAVGDVHGDYDALVTLLAGCHVIDRVRENPADVRWAAGRAVLVCTGDLIDRGNQGLRVIELFRTLEVQAAGAGGRVVVTLGNHEAEFLATGGHAKINKEFVAELRAAGLTPAKVVAGRDGAGVGQYLLDLPVAARVNDAFFCHAGNTRGLTLAQLAERVRAGIDRQGYTAPVVADADSIVQARLHPRPWWEADAAAAVELRDAATPRRERAEAGRDRLAANLRALGVAHLVFGHQPMEITFADKSKRAQDEMFCGFGGLFFLIDTGMSRGVDGGRGALLRFRREGKGETATAVYGDGSARELWSGDRQ
jgi:hypothetical protein